MARRMRIRQLPLTDGNQMLRISCKQRRQCARGVRLDFVIWYGVLPRFYFAVYDEMGLTLPSIRSLCRKSSVVGVMPAVRTKANWRIVKRFDRRVLISFNYKLRSTVSLSPTFKFFWLGNSKDVAQTVTTRNE